MALKKQTFYNILIAFSSDTPQSIKCQNKGPKEHDENIYPVVDRNRPIRKTQAQDRKIYFHRVLPDPYSDVLCSEECQTKSF